MADLSNVLGNTPNKRMQIYPTLDHFHRASQSGWMRPFDLAEYEAYRDAESERAAPSFAPAPMQHTGMTAAGNSTSDQAHADCELAAAN